MKYIYTKTFTKSYKSIVQSYPKIGQKIQLCVDDFELHLFQSQYFRKKLKSFDSVYELEVTGDYRVFVQVKVEDATTYFLNVGTHSQLGLSGDNPTKITNLK